MSVQGISSALFAPGIDSADATAPRPTAAVAQAREDVAQNNHEAAAAAAVPANATATIYNARGQTNQVGSVPSAPHGK
jgi:hypothetical protein